MPFQRSSQCEQDIPPSIAKKIGLFQQVRTLELTFLASVPSLSYCENQKSVNNLIQILTCQLRTYETVTKINRKKKEKERGSTLCTIIKLKFSRFCDQTVNLQSDFK